MLLAQPADYSLRLTLRGFSTVTLDTSRLTPQLTGAMGQGQTVCHESLDSFNARQALLVEEGPLQEIHSSLRKETLTSHRRAGPCGGSIIWWDVDQREALPMAVASQPSVRLLLLPPLKRLQWGEKR